MMRHTRISSRSNPQLVRVRQLRAEPLAYRKLHQVWLEGEHLVRAALARGMPLDAVLVDEARESEPQLAPLLQAAPQLLTVETRLWRETSGLPSPPPVAALMAMPPAVPLAADRCTVVLDRLQDAGNVGSILRSAAAFGFAQLIALKGCAGLWSPKVLRAAQGAHFALQLHEESAWDRVAELGVPLVATSSHDGAPLPTVPLPDPCAWVFGHEGQGVTASLLQQCKLRVAIPQPGGEESLNVAAAAAVCLYESMRRRGMSGQ